MDTPIQTLCHEVRNATTALYQLVCKKLPARDKARASVEILRIETALRDYLDVSNQKPVDPEH